LNELSYFNETAHSYSVEGERDTDDLEKVTGSKVKVAFPYP